MVTRLDAPFTATRLYGLLPLAVGWDILTLPFQVSNVLTGFPPIAIPNFGLPQPPAAAVPQAKVKVGDRVRNDNQDFGRILTIIGFGTESSLGIDIFGREPNDGPWWAFQTASGMIFDEGRIVGQDADGTWVVDI